jgi:hypothetical protein
MAGHAALGRAQEAYAHEVSGAGFWSGGDNLPQAIFYSFAYPSPQGLGKANVEPEPAAWSAELGEFVLPYDAVREPLRIRIARCAGSQAY